jgi:hypothetical protein
VPIAGATGATLDIASVERTNGGNYSVVVSNSSGSVTSSVVSLTYNNTAPEAGDSFTFGAVVGLASTVQIIGGQFPPADADGDLLTITSVSGAVNGSATTDGTNVTYTASGGNSDSFSYTVSDGFGGTASQTLNVNIAPSAGYNQLSTQWISGQEVLSFAGIPNNSYALEWTDNLMPPVTWAALFTNTAADDGSLHFTNTPSGNASFYRTRIQ